MYVLKKSAKHTLQFHTRYSKQHIHISSITDPDETVSGLTVFSLHVLQSSLKLVPVAYQLSSRLRLLCPLTEGAIPKKSIRLSLNVIQVSFGIGLANREGSGETVRMHSLS